MTLIQSSLALLVCSLLLFSFLAIAIVRFPLGIGLETNFLEWLHTHSYPWLDQCALKLTNLGIRWGTTPILLGLALILVLHKQWRSFYYVTITSLGTIALNYGSKYLFDRPRPHLWKSSYIWPTDPSFPSGHSLSSMMLAMVLITLSWPYPWRWWVVLLGGLFAALIAWTRLYLGVHYLSDILGGWCLAISWNQLVYLLVNQRQSILKDQ